MMLYFSDFTFNTLFNSTDRLRDFLQTNLSMPEEDVDAILHATVNTHEVNYQWNTSNY